LPDLLQMMVTFGLFILIWIIQILHYPSFLHYDEKTFPQAMISHQSAISIIVMPLMLTELFVTFFIFYKNTNIYSTSILVIVLLIWLSTFLIQVPIHKKLLSGKDTNQIHKLIRTNWSRTFLWSLKLGVLAIWYWQL
jgi:hypothetical protein